MTKNVVSILCPSYNHEKYVGFFINSLLQQTNSNWELVIVDDCSTDNNVKEIQKFKDSRIKLIKNQFNMGVNCGLNKAFSESSGQYISFCASDDMLMPDYVENVFRTFEEHPDRGIIYCDLQIMDNNNELIKDKVYTTSRDDKYKVLRNSFMYGNCVNSPGMAVKRELFNTLLPLDIPMSQYQDYKMHIDLLLQSDFVVMDKISVLYRKNDDQSGLSAFTDMTLKRRQLEENLLMDSYLKIQDVSLLEKIFETDLGDFSNVSKKTIPFVLGQLALNSREKYKKVWGYNQISKFINNPENYALVHKIYGFSYKDFLNLAAKFENAPIEKKYKKYKRLFNRLLVVIAVLILTIIGIVVF